jgi:hypothetical protein
MGSEEIELLQLYESFGHGSVCRSPLWGRVAHYGARRLLWIGGTSIVPVAALWLAADLFAPYSTTLRVPVASWTCDCPLSAEMAYLGVIQLVSGVAWAAYELAMLLMFFEAIPRQDRASVLTFYNFGNAAALVVGGLIGAAILQLGNERTRTWPFSAARSAHARC